MGKKPLVSIVIPTFNSEKTLPLTLESIKRQTYKNIEVIVVDNFSIDRTIEIAKQYGAKVIRCRAERSKAKNLGLRNAKGEYVLFIDSDMRLTPRVVEECVKKAESNPSIGGIIIPEITLGSSYWARVRRYERLIYIGTPIESPRFFRKRLALEVGGFDENIVFYEEATLPLKIEQLGYNVRARISAPILHLEHDITLSTLLKKKYYYAKTLSIYIKKYKNNITISQINPVYRFKIIQKRIKYIYKPSIIMGVILLKVLEYIASLVGYIVGHVHYTRKDTKNS